MRIFMVQHGKARKEEEDPLKSLSEEGRSDVRKMAEFLTGRRNLRVETILHSGKLRARQTAEILAEKLDPPRGVGKGEGLDALADPSIWAGRLDETVEDLMLVGHMPHLGKLSASLLCGDENSNVIDFQMGGVVCLQRDHNDVWSVQWIVTPELL